MKLENEKNSPLETPRDETEIFRDREAGKNATKNIHFTVLAPRPPPMSRPGLPSRRSGNQVYNPKTLAAATFHFHSLSSSRDSLSRPELFEQKPPIFIIFSCVDHHLRYGPQKRTTRTTS